MLKGQQRKSRRIKKKTEEKKWPLNNIEVNKLGK